MSLEVDLRYAHIVGMKLLRFRQKGQALFNFRCPFCGDSREDPTKARGYLYRREDRLQFRCHNCNHGTSMGGLIKQAAPEDYRSYRMELFRGNSSSESFFDSFLLEQKEKRASLQSTSMFHDLHKAIDVKMSRDYLRSRSLPSKVIEQCYHVGDSKVLMDRYSDVPLPDCFAAPGIVFPLIAADSVEFGFQIRFFDVVVAPNSKKQWRYLTKMVNDGYTKAWGLDRVDRSKRIHVAEGIFDAALMPNPIAALDGDLRSVASKLKLSRDDTVLLFDNQPRNLQVMRAMRAAIEDGWPVAFFRPEFNAKDLSEGVEHGEISADDVMQAVTVAQGNMAMLKMQRFDKTESSTPLTKRKR